MKTIKVWLVLVFCVLVNSQIDRRFGLEVKNNANIAVLEAIKGILTNHFALVEPHVDLFYCGPESEVLAGKLLREKTAEVTIRAVRLEAVEKVVLSAPAIFLFDSSETY